MGYDSDMNFDTEYDALNAFNDYLDEVSGEVTLADGLTRSASYVLSEVDPVSHRCMFLDWCDAMDIDLDRLGEDDEDECEGHESLDGAHMGETVYCDGSCI